MRDIADAAGITERTVQVIVADLEAAGHITRTRAGRRVRYTVNPAACSATRPRTATGSARSWPSWPPPGRQQPSPVTCEPEQQFHPRPAARPGCSPDHAGDPVAGAEQLTADRAGPGTARRAPFHIPPDRVRH